MSYRENPAPLKARQKLKAERFEAYVARVVAEAPPLTEDQKHRIASLLSGGQR